MFFTAALPTLPGECPQQFLQSEVLPAPILPCTQTNPDRRVRQGKTVARRQVQPRNEDKSALITRKDEEEDEDKVEEEGEEKEEEVEESKVGGASILGMKSGIALAEQHKMVANPDRATAPRKRAPKKAKGLTDRATIQGLAVLADRKGGERRWGWRRRKSQSRAAALLLTKPRLKTSASKGPIQVPPPWPLPMPISAAVPKAASRPFIITKGLRLISSEDLLRLFLENATPPINVQVTLRRNLQWYG